MTNEGTAEKKGRSESRSVKVLERQSDPSINAKWIVFGAGAATVSLGAAIGVLGLATLSTWVVCAVLIAAGLLVYQLSAASLLRQEEIPVIATSVIPPWERVTELGFFEDILPKKYESRTPSNNAALQGSTDTSRSEMRIVQRLARAVTETPEVLRSEKRVIRGVVKPIDLPAAVKEFELPVFNATALEGLADLVVLDPDQSVEEFEAAVDERVKTLVAEDQAFMKKALMVIVALVSKKLNGATGVAFNLGSSEGESLEEALALFSHVDDLVALLPKSLSRVQAKGIRAIRLPSVAKYRPSGSLQNSNGVPVLEGGEAADAGIASNRNLYGVVSQGEVASLSEQSSKLLDKVSRIAVAILLAQRRVKKSDLDAANWKAELLSELTHSGLVANDGGLISIDGNGNVIVHLDVLASIIQQMIQTKATAVSA